MLALLVFAACSTPVDTAETGETGEETAAAIPSIAWVSPEDEASVGSTVNASVAVENFLLLDPAKHSEGDAAGFIRVTANDAELGDFGTTTFTLSSLPVGAVALVAQLFYDDGDEIIVNEAGVCDEDDTTGTCEPVTATVLVTVSPGG
ncbi:hypothetical protein LBMAG42_36870 [Deltaproteobacteria bacterium]|nr:hypothetical protein LBMAG42_36870 [Deltaproteobacteria bacterium]